MDPKAVVIPGEAPESDDDSVNVTTGFGFPIKRARNPCGTIIPGEAPESDDDGTTSLSSISGAIEATVCPPYAEAKIKNKTSRHSYKYNSLLHKKLRECHQALDKDLTDICESVVGKNVQELTSSNRNLLKSEMTLQEAASQLREASNRSKDVANALINITDANFLHSIKI